MKTIRVWISPYMTFSNFNWAPLLDGGVSPTNYSVFGSDTEFSKKTYEMNIFD